MRVIRYGLLAAAIGLAPMAASAQTATGTLKWNGPGKSFAWYWRVGNAPTATAEYVMGGGSYSAMFQMPTTPILYPWPAHGTTGFGPAVDIYCVDFSHWVNTSSSGYSAYFSKVTAGSLANTREGEGGLTRYLSAAWLITKMETYGTSTVADKAQRAQIHGALWWIMSGEPTGSWTGSGSADANTGNYNNIDGLNSWVSQAQMASNYSTVNGSEWTVVTDACVTNVNHNGAGTPVSDNCSQEFLTHNVVPEPATMILMGTGLLATFMVVGISRKQTA